MDADVRRASNEAMVPITRMASSEEQPFDVTVERMATETGHDTQSIAGNVGILYFGSCLLPSHD